MFRVKTKNIRTYSYEQTTNYKTIFNNFNVTYNESNTIGSAQNMSVLQTVDFHVGTLWWSSANWNFVDGAYPTLKNVGTTN